MSGETAKATLARFAMALSGFVGTVLFARLLGPASFGGFYLLFGLVKIVDRPIHGWATAAKKRFSEHDTQSKSVVGAQIVFIVVWLFLVGVVSLLFSKWLQEYTGLVLAPLPFIIRLASEPLYEPFEKLVQGRSVIGVATWTDALRSYLTLPLQLWFVMAGFSAAGMVDGLAGDRVLSVPIVLYFLRTPPPSRLVRYSKASGSTQSTAFHPASSGPSMTDSTCSYSDCSLHRLLQVIMRSLQN